MTGPYDRLFRYVFNAPARAEVLLRHNLPEWLISAVNWSSLRRESGTLVDWRRETRNDLLFSARYLHSAEEEPPHFFLLEHQSTVERWMVLRTLDYSGRLMRNWHEAHPAARGYRKSLPWWSIHSGEAAAGPRRFGWRTATG